MTRTATCDTCGRTWREDPASAFAGVCYHCTQAGKPAVTYRGKT